MYKDLTFGRRFLLIIIDYLILGVICYLCFLGCTYIFFNDLTIPEEINTWMNNQGSIDELINLINSSVEVRAFVSKEMQFLGILVLVTFILHLLYFVLIPLLWKKQTIGRWLCKTKLVRENNSELRTSNYLMREIVGNIFISIFTLICGVLPIINLVFIITKNRSIADLFSGTKLIDLSSNLLEDDSDIITVIPEDQE